MRSFLLIVILWVTSVTAATAQRKLTEATITYDIVLSTSNTSPKLADMFDGATNVVYMKGHASRTEMVSSLGTQATIFDGRTKNATILKEYGDQKFLITLNADDWKSYNKRFDNIAYELVDFYKNIAGYNCQKAIGTLNDGTTFTVYFTRELVPMNKDFQYISKNLPGLALQYEASQGKAKVTYTATNVNFGIVPLAKFDVPKAGYRVLTYAESMQGK